VKPRALVLLPLVLVTAGCFEGQRTIHVKADGSGTVVDSLILGEQMKAMMAGADTGKEAEAKEKAKYVAAAAAMGPGVRFVGEEKTPQGMKVTFAFDDIRNARIDISPGPAGDEGGSQKKSDPLTFRFAHAGTRSTLTVVQPRPPAKEKAAAGTPASDPMQQMGMAMWTMMKPMMKGLKLRTVLEVDGAIVRTNSKLARGPVVTLLDMDFDQIAADDANFKRFARAGDDPSAMDPKLLQMVKGIKVNPDPEVVIEFTGN
jgi:hypothetical protein